MNMLYSELHKWLEENDVTFYMLNTQSDVLYSKNPRSIEIPEPIKSAIKRYKPYLLWNTRAKQNPQACYLCRHWKEIEGGKLGDCHGGYYKQAARYATCEQWTEIPERLHRPQAPSEQRKQELLGGNVA